MKKIITLGTAAIVSLASMAQESANISIGRIEVKDCGTFILHVYNTNDVMSDASYIIEGSTSLVTMEQPLFKDNVAEFDRYLSALGKPVEKRISNYHLGGTASNDIVMAQGMPSFTRQGVYAAMMKGFAQTFGESIVDLPTGHAEEVNFDSTQTWAGVTFTFNHGASTDFPAASINIGGKAYLTHWAPATAHMNALQITSPAVIDAELAATNDALQSGCVLFLGGHGGMADKSAAEFKVKYLTAMKQAYTSSTSAEQFIEAMKSAFPNLEGENALNDIARNLYK